MNKLVKSNRRIYMYTLSRRTTIDLQKTVLHMKMRGIGEWNSAPGAALKGKARVALQRKRTAEGRLQGAHEALAWRKPLNSD
jgi:hypothetical protein